ncbi:hypothetical protein J2128_000568 [Methanomicrobium sp. W14]|uniref:sensor histidine kinase n=1 Tax=Methanomicrobium sp. W14 TaxID=2817839 RepID=UPI001AE293F5|nr:sensor histidine kinase [Methanomicrobium sp. W14]MBP2132647.1 hypothetical protein [Methanomicrobium sp. W14]
MTSDYESGITILTKILNQSYKPDSFIFDASNGANIILDLSGEVIIANSAFFRIFGTNYASFSGGIFLSDFFDENETSKLRLFLKERVGDQYNSPKTIVLYKNPRSDQKGEVIITGVRIPGTGSIFISAVEARLDMVQESVLKLERDLQRPYSKVLPENEVISRRENNKVTNNAGEKKLPKKGSQKSFQLKLINRILVSAGSVFIFGKMLDSILKIILTDLKLDIGYISIKSADGKTANIASSSDVPAGFIEKYGIRNIRSWPDNLVFYAGQPMFVENLPNIELGKNDLDILESLNALSYSIVPFITDNTVIGALFVAKADEYRFTQFEKETLALIGRKAGSIILRGMLQEKLESECNEARKCFGLIFEDIFDINENLLLSMESIGDTGMPRGDLTEKIVSDIKSNRKLLSNLKTLRESCSTSLFSSKEISVDDSMHRTLERFHETVIDYRDCGGYVYADDNLAEVFSNLIDFMVETGRNEKNNNSIIVTPEILPGNVIISFENAGTSLTEEKKMSLFSKFENENLHLDLTSTGLYTAYSLVKKYGGTIEAVDRIAGDSKKGLKLKVYLLRSYSYKPENLLT